MPAKSLWVHMADQADADGIVRASVRRLMALTGMGRRTVQEARRWLEEHGYVQLLDAGGGRQQAHYLVLVPAAAADYPRASRTGAPAAPVQEPHFRQCATRAHVLITDPIKSRKAEPAARAPEMPTRDQLTKFVATIIDDEQLQVESRVDLEGVVEKACFQAGFAHSRQTVEDAINRVLAARGFNPQHQVDFADVRRRRAR